MTIERVLAKFGFAIDPFGDHGLSCPSCLSDRIPGHGLVVDAVASIARHVSKHAAHSSRRPRDASHAYAPNLRPNITPARALMVHGLDSARTEDFGIKKKIKKIMIHLISLKIPLKKFLVNGKTLTQY